jgi:hypothetical protein
MSYPHARRDWLWPLTGLGFFLAAGSGIVFSMVLPPEPYPSPFGAPLGPQTDIARFFIEARPQVVLMSVMYSIAAIFLVCFVADVASRIWARAGTADTWGSLAMAGGVLAAGFWLLTAMLLWVLARPWTPEQPNLVRALHDLTYLTGGPAHVLTLGLFAAAGAVGLPRGEGAVGALRWAGLAGAAVSLVSVVALLFDPATLLLPVGRGLILVWIAGVAIWLAWSGRTSETRVVDGFEDRRRPRPAALTTGGHRR